MSLKEFLKLLRENTAIYSPSPDDMLEVVRACRDVFTILTEKSYTAPLRPDRAFRVGKPTPEQRRDELQFAIQEVQHSTVVHRFMLGLLPYQCPVPEYRAMSLKEFACGWSSETMEDLILVTSILEVADYVAPEKVRLSRAKVRRFREAAERLEHEWSIAHDRLIKASKAGVKVIDGGRAGQVLAHGSYAERRERKEEIIREFDALFPSKHSKKMRAYNEVARKLGVAARTVRRVVGSRK